MVIRMSLLIALALHLTVLTTAQLPITPRQTYKYSRGIAGIVTPVNDASVFPTTFASVSGKSQACNCVAYHMCDPSKEEARVTTNEDFDSFGLIDLRFGDEPICPSSVEVCCETERVRNVSLNPTPLANRPNRLTGCGIRNNGGIDFNLTGVSLDTAGFAEFPWTVALLHATNASYFCGGSLIHPSVVLTAAHCLTAHTAESFLIRAGEWDMQTDNERLPYEQRYVQSIVRHPLFNGRSAAYDFALIILGSPVNLNDHINVVCLVPTNYGVPAGSNCISTGWGKDAFGAEGKFSVIMKRIDLPIIDFNQCQQALRKTRLGNRFILDPSFICAGGKIGTDTCTGDGGAPLACPIGHPTNNRYQQSGIVSWGIGSNSNIPAAYANVALAREWIDEQMLSNGFGIHSYTP